MTRCRSLRHAVVLTLALASVVSPAAGRTLSWPAVEVEARLDGDGKLLVIERQHMLFDGDWNGGERIFRVEPGQDLELFGVQRIAADGAPVRLERGDLDAVDRYDWHKRHTLRWRSRLPSDPPFDDTSIVYELYYSLSGVVERRGDDGDVYRLGHNFVFAERLGPVESFALDLKIDPEWRVVSAGGLEVESAPTGSRIRFEKESLGYAQSALVELDLERTVAAAPSAIRAGVPKAARWALAAGLLASAVFFGLRFRAHERRQGRFDPPLSPGGIDRGWIEQRLLNLRAEEVGALWDQTIGKAEVSALIARWVAAGRVVSSVREGGKRPVMELELAVDRDDFTGYERALIDDLFFDGRSRTDTEAVRAKYKGVGFSPAVTITPGLKARLKKLPAFGRPIPSPGWKPTFALIVVAALLLAGEALTRGQDAAGPAFGIVVGVQFTAAMVAILFASLYRKRADRLGLGQALFLAPMLVSLAVAAVVIVSSEMTEIGVLGLGAIALFGIAMTRSGFNWARTRDRREAVARRRELAAVRRHLADELEKPQPELEDEWTPYLLAFGLQRGMDRWAKSYGSETTRSSVSSFSSSSSSSGSGWTGGGGAFGGAGATAAWTAAAGTMAAGVAAPSSSGSGGGGGSSGGGGGGGW